MPTEQQFQKATRSTILSRIRARLQVNSVSKFIAWSKEAPRGFTVFQVNGFLKPAKEMRSLLEHHMNSAYQFQNQELGQSHYLSLFLGSSIMLVGCYSGVLVTMARKETFARSQPQLQAKFGATHREAFGPDASINKFGWPDSGSGKFADVLSYGDWVKINNAQRQHEFGYENMIVILPNAFISALKYPRATNFLLGAYLVLRIMHVNSYTDTRGHNKAYAPEEFMRSVSTMLILLGMASSFRLTGIPARFSSRLGQTWLLQKMQETRVVRGIQRLKGRQ